MGSGMPRPRWPLRRRATRPRAERSNERAGGGGDARLCLWPVRRALPLRPGPGARAATPRQARTPLMYDDSDKNYQSQNGSGKS